MRNLAIFVAAAVVVVGANTAFGVPLLQIYLEGGTYDATTESWVVAGPSGGGSVRLWVIGNTQGPGSVPGTISDVKLSVAYSDVWNFGNSEETSLITLSPSTANGYGGGGFTDPSVPDSDLSTLGIQDPQWLQFRNDGSSPVLSTGKSLPTHGIFGADTDWQEFLLGDFSLADSPVADFIGAFPTVLYPSTGQINVYDVTIPGGYHGAVLHFDVYDHVEGRNGARFAPFSHDGSGSGGGFENVVPEPSSMVLCSGLALMGLISARRRRKVGDPQAA